MGRGKFGAGSSMEAALIPEGEAKKKKKKKVLQCQTFHKSQQRRGRRESPAHGCRGINSLSGSSGASFGVGSRPPSGFVSIPGLHEVPL